MHCEQRAGAPDSLPDVANGPPTSPRARNDHRGARCPERMRKLIAFANLSPAAAAVLTRLPSSQHRSSASATAAAAPPPQLPLNSPSSGGKYHNAYVWDSTSNPALTRTTRQDQEPADEQRAGRALVLKSTSRKSRSSPLHHSMAAAQKSPPGSGQALLRTASAPWSSTRQPSSLYTPQEPSCRLHDGLHQPPTHFPLRSFGNRWGNSSHTTSPETAPCSSSAHLAGLHSQNARRGSAEVPAPTTAAPIPALGDEIPGEPARPPATSVTAPAALPPGKNHMPASSSAAHLHRVPDVGCPSVASGPARVSGGKAQRSRCGSPAAGSAQELTTFIPTTSPTMVSAASQQSTPDNDGISNQMQWVQLGPGHQADSEAARAEGEPEYFGSSRRLGRLGSACSERRVELLMAPSGSLLLALSSTHLWQAEGVPENAAEPVSPPPAAASDSSCRLSRTSRSRKLPRFGPSNLVLPLDARRSSSCTVGGAGGEATEKLRVDRQPACTPPAVPAGTASKAATQSLSLAMRTQAGPDGASYSCGLKALLRRLRRLLG